MAVESYESFSGADIRVLFGGLEVGSLQAISWAVEREKAALYTMGSPNPRSFSRGKRGIAGSLVFLVFQKDLLLREVFNERKVTISNTEKSTFENHSLPGNRARTVDPEEWKSPISPLYADQIPPFTVSLAGTNEYGRSTKKTIYNVELLNEQGGTSIDDIVLEQRYTFVATHIDSWGLDDSPGAAKLQEGTK